MADMNDHPGQAGERLAPVNDAALRRSIADLQSVVNDGVLLDEIENWPGFAESLALCLHELQRLQAEAASAQPATRLAPQDWDVQMLLHGVLIGCPCCNGTPSTFSRHFAHSGIYQSYTPKPLAGGDAGAVGPTQRELTYAFLKLRLSEKREVAKTLCLPDPYRVDAGLDQDKAFLRIVFAGDRTSDFAAALAPYMPDATGP